MLIFDELGYVPIHPVTLDVTGNGFAVEHILMDTFILVGNSGESVGRMKARYQDGPSAFSSKRSQK